MLTKQPEQALANVLQVTSLSNIVNICKLSSSATICKWRIFFKQKSNKKESKKKKLFVHSVSDKTGRKGRAAKEHLNELQGVSCLVVERCRNGSKGRTAKEHFGWPAIGWLWRREGAPGRVVRDDLQRDICDELLGRSVESCRGSGKGRKGMYCKIEFGMNYWKCALESWRGTRTGHLGGHKHCQLMNVLRHGQTPALFHWLLN